MNEIPHAVRSASEHAICIQEHGRRVFQLLGKDGLDLLHRLSTNDLFAGPPNRAIRTAFCNEKGRLIEVAELVVTKPESFLICSATGSGKLMSWIARFTIAEDIQLIDVSSEYSVASLLGPHAVSSATHAGLVCEEREPGEVCNHMTDQALAWESMFGSLTSVRILAKQGILPTINGRLKETGVRIADARSVYEFLRVLHSVPEFGHEVTDAFTPYEAGLGETVSRTKGCYVGQEVLARLETYKKPLRELRMLWSDAPDQPRRGTAVMLSGEVAGVVTSTVRAGSRILVLAVLSKHSGNLRDVVRITDYPYVLNEGPLPPFSLILPPEKQ